MNKQFSICFLGNMNNFPFGLAKRFNEKGYNVKLFIDTPPNYLLDRPESQDPLLMNNYPDWIEDINLKDHGGLRLIKLLFPTIFYIKLINKLCTFDVVFLNGDWIKLSKYLPNTKYVGGLFAGADLEIASLSNVITETKKYKAKFNLIPEILIKILIERSIKLQMAGIRRVNSVNYYLPEVSIQGDQIIDELKANQNYSRLLLRGFDTVQFEYQEPKINSKEFIILNITRFNFTSETIDNKRNDLMITGIAKFIKENNITENLKIIFFEKGPDTKLAKTMCDNFNISQFITWKEVVSIVELKEYFGMCHVAFDQLGNQWLGAGLFSMLTGRPLIANARNELYEKYLGVTTPVCQAKSDEDISGWLTKFYKNRSLIKTIGSQSRDFVQKYYDLSLSIEFYRKDINLFFKDYQNEIL